MKKISEVLIMGIFLLGINLFAANAQQQKSNQQHQTSTLKEERMGIAYDKTSNVIFPHPIKSIDRGSQDVLVQKAAGVENILQLKAAKPGFAETSLTVVTADGSVFTYLLHYQNNPASLTHRITKEATTLDPLAVFTKDATTSEIERTATVVAVKKRTIRKEFRQKYGVVMDLKGLYVFNDVLYFQMVLQNNSVINYDINLLRFFIGDKKKSKRTASQELDLSPSFIYGNASVIRDNSEQTIVVAVPKFTIPDKKFLGIQLMEKAGGRHLELRLSHKHIMKAILLN